jgi:hypothetical protein
MAYSSRQTVNATRARQGRFGRHMIWVLLFGTLLAAIGLLAAWTWKAPDLARGDNPNRADMAAKSRSFNTPEPPPPTPTAPR